MRLKEAKGGGQKMEESNEYNGTRKEGRKKDMEK
jgi:hypothetical protein